MYTSDTRQKSRHLRSVVAPDGQTSHVGPVVQLPVSKVAPDEATREGLTEVTPAPCACLRMKVARAHHAPVQVCRQPRNCTGVCILAL